MEYRTVAVDGKHEGLGYSVLKDRTALSETAHAGQGGQSYPTLNAHHPLPTKLPKHGEAAFRHSTVSLAYITSSGGALRRSHDSPVSVP